MTADEKRFADAVAERVAERLEAGKREPMTVKALSAYSGWSVKTIYKKCCDGELPYYKAAGGNMTLFDRKEIDKVLFGTRIAPDGEIAAKADALARAAGL